MSTEARPVTPVGILAATLAAAKRRVEVLPGGQPELVAEVGRAASLAAGLDPYLERCSSPESPALAELSRRTAAVDWGARDGAGVMVTLEREMLSGHLEGRFLAFLVRLSRARRVLEIGTFTGYSALAMAEALPGDGRLVALELDPEAAAFAREAFARSPGGEKIELRVGPAAASLAELAAAGASFDLVFIDADKGGYLEYFETLLDEGLLAPGGLVCVDNTLLQGEPYLEAEPSPNGAAIAAFNQAVAADPRVEQVLLPLRDGLTLIMPLATADRDVDPGGDGDG